jgi:hypothetical protein
MAVLFGRSPLGSPCSNLPTTLTSFIHSRPGTQCAWSTYQGLACCVVPRCSQHMLTLLPVDSDVVLLLWWSLKHLMYITPLAVVCLRRQQGEQVGIPYLSARLPCGHGKRQPGGNAVHRLWRVLT